MATLRRLVAAGLTFGVLAAPSEAGGRGSSLWSAPVQIPRPAAYPGALVYAGDGRAVLNCFGNIRSELAISDRSGVFRVRARLRPHELVVPVTFGRHGLVLARQRTRDTYGRRFQVGVSFGDTSGGDRPVSPHRRLPERCGRGGDTDGAAALVWLEPAGRGRQRVRLAERLAGRTFGPPRTVATVTQPENRLPLPAPQVAFVRRGRFVVVWADARPRGVVEARVGQIGGALERSQTLGRHDLGGDPGRQLALKIAAAGRHVAVAWGPVWTGVQIDERWIERVTGATAPRWHFGAVRRLGSARRGRGQGGDLALGLARDGRATLAWTEPDGEWPQLPVVLAAVGKPGGDFGPTVELGRGLELNAAIRRDGTGIVTWSGGPPATTFQQPQSLMAALHAPGAAGFGPPEAVSAPTQGTIVGVVAFDPSSGRPVVAWAERGLWTAARSAPPPNGVQSGVQLSATEPN